MTDRDTQRIAQAPSASFGAFEYAVLSAIGVCAAVSILVLALVLYPFEPYRVYSATVLPTSACPGGSVEVSGDSEIEDGWRLRRLEVDSVWMPVGKDAAGAPTSGGTGEIIAPEPRERGVVVSSIVREAPEEPGAYRLFTRATVYGTFGRGNIFSGFPKTQREEYRSRDVVVVRDGPGCKADSEADSETESGGDA